MIRRMSCHSMQPNTYQVLLPTSKKTSLRNFDFPVLTRITAQKYSKTYRAVWGLAVMTCWTLSVYHLQDRVRFYLDTPIGTAVSISRNQSIRYPMMTVCPVGENTMARMTLMKHVAPKINKSLCDVSYADLMEELNMTYAEILQKIHLEEGIQPFCHMGSTESSEPIPDPCTVTRSFSDFLICVTLSCDFKSVVFSSTNEFMITGSAPRDCKRPMYEVFVHENEYEPLWNRLNNEGGYLTKFSDEVLAISVAEFTYVNTAINPCLDGNSFKRCIEKWLGDIITSANLSCVVSDLQQFTSIELCKTFVDGQESFQHLIKVVGKSKNPCGRPCREIIYRLNGFGRSNPNNTNYEISLKFLDNIVSVSEEYYLYSFVSLICDIGGNIGLYLGVCVLSIFEVVDTCSNYLLKAGRKIY